jgi:hypothetical protein
MVLDNFYGFIIHHVEILSPEEKTACNNIIIAEVALAEAKKRFEEWQGSTSHTLSRLNLQKSCIVYALKNRALMNAQKDHMLAEKKRIEDNVSMMVQDRMQLENDVSNKRKTLGENVTMITNHVTTMSQ